MVSRHIFSLRLTPAAYATLVSYAKTHGYSLNGMVNALLISLPPADTVDITPPPDA